MGMVVGAQGEMEWLNRKSRQALPTEESKACAWGKSQGRGRGRVRGGGAQAWR